VKIKQYDIWIADLNPRLGTEAGKVRPVLIVQTDLLNEQHPSTVICPITSNVQGGADILRVHLKKATFGLERDCDVMIDQVRAIDNKRLLEKIGELDRSAREKIRNNLKIIFDLD